MMKTQDSVLKRCISNALFLLIFIGFLPRAKGYTATAPLESQMKASNGLIFEPRIGFPSIGHRQTEMNLNLNAGLNSEVSLFGRYSLLNDHLAGVSLNIKEISGIEIHAQIETLYTQASSFGATGALFGRFPLSYPNLPNFSFESGLGFTYDLDSEVSKIPMSFMLLHNPESSGWIYGAGLSGVLSPSNNQTQFNFQFLWGFQNKNATQYKLSTSLPTGKGTSLSDLSVLFGFEIPLGVVPPSSASEFLSPPPISNGSSPRYGQEAKVISMNEALFLIKINKGSRDSVTKGQIFDVYSGDNLIARARVKAVKNNEAALVVVEYKEEHWIELGFSARLLLE